MALGTLTMSKSGRIPGCFDTATGGATAGTYSASTIAIIPSGMVAVAPMINSGGTFLYISAQGIDQTLGVTGNRGMIGVPAGAGPLGTLKTASAGVNYLRLCGAQIERTAGSTVKIAGGSL